MLSSITQKITEIWIQNEGFFQNHLMIGFLLAVFAFATYTDIKERKIYDNFNFLVFCVRGGFLFMPTYAAPLTMDNFLGGLLGFIIFLIPAVVFMQKMGGDLKFILVIGFYLGTGLTLFLIAISCCYMLLYSLLRKLVKKVKVKHLATPMAPFFSLAFLTLYIISLL